MHTKLTLLSITILLLIPFDIFPKGECDNWQIEHPDWIFCDDFESDDPMVKRGRYFEYGDNNGDFVVQEGVGFNNSRGMQVVFQQGEVGAGGMKLAFGRNPNSYMNKQQISPDRDFREIYYRMYLKMEKGWQGNPAKLSRATVFTSAADWRQAMIAHLWSDGKDHLLIDPASCVNSIGEVECVGYNDFDHLSWLGNKSGKTPIFNSEYDDTWFCIEHHVKLNDPGESNGIQEFWIDDSLEARRENLNFTGTYTEYAINAIFFENYWNSGSIKEQRRYFDNIVVSTKRIGCADTGVAIIPRRYLHNQSSQQIYVRYFKKQSVLKLYGTIFPNNDKCVIIHVCNCKGIMLLQYRCSAKDMANGYTISTTSLAQGAYFISVNSGTRNHLTSVSTVF